MPYRDSMFDRREFKNCLKSCKGRAHIITIWIGSDFKVRAIAKDLFCDAGVLIFSLNFCFIFKTTLRTPHASRRLTVYGSL